jgi:hypothetical protein
MKREKLVGRVCELVSPISCILFEAITALPSKNEDGVKLVKQFYFVPHNVKRRLGNFNFALPFCY